MFRVGLRQRSCRIGAVLAASLLVSGCAAFISQPLVFGSYRSIKDDAEDAAAPATAPKATAPSKAAAAPKPSAPPKQRKATYRPASAPPPAACDGERDCMVQLKSLIDNPDRSWIGTPEAPANQATGTRLFAYRALHAQLSCDELARAIDELAVAGGSFNATPPGISAQKAERVRALNADVETELRAERTRRCSG
jgi:hypothetical protein